MSGQGKNQFQIASKHNKLLHGVNVKTKLLVVITILLLAVAVMYAGTLVETSLPEQRDKSATPNNTTPPPDLYSR